MAIDYLKQGISQQNRADADAKVRATVEATLADIDARGDAAVRDLSVKFDGYDPVAFRLTEADIEDAMSKLSSLEDIYLLITSSIVPLKTHFPFSNKMPLLHSFLNEFKL